MKSNPIAILLFITLLITVAATSSFRFNSQDEPWTSAQLLAPADLANTINDSAAKQPVILCIGPGAVIKGSTNIGPTNEKENMKRLAKALKNLPKDASIVIYCGCCPFEHCPNIRPAFTLLNKMKFQNHMLLNIEHNIKTDWIDKNYPVAQE